MEKIFIILSISLIIFFGCSSRVKNTSPDKSSEAIIEIQKMLKKQEALLARLQALLADQILRNNELEQSIPPKDLLESLQNIYVELQNKINTFEKQLLTLKQDLEKLKIKNDKSKTNETDLVENQMDIILGLISLHAGNPSDAKEHFNEIILDSSKTKIKGEILMAIGQSFLSQGHSKQAASHYGIFLREFPDSHRVPQALYFLGIAMEELGERKKKQVLWDDLIKKFPDSHFSKRAKKILEKSSKPKS